MEETIMRKEALQLIRSGALVDVCFVSADRRRGTGGKYVEMNRVSVKQTDTGKGEKSNTPLSTPSKKQNNHENRTVMLHNPFKKFLHPTPVHIRLIHRVNGKRVIQ